MERRRSKLEYINSVGATYRAAGAAHLTLKLIINWLRREMINLTGVAPNASNTVIAEELSRRKGDDYHKYKDVLDETDKLLGQKKLTERQLLSITRQLAQIETEVFNEHRNR